MTTQPVYSFSLTWYEHTDDANGNRRVERSRIFEYPSEEQSKQHRRYVMANVSEFLPANAIVGDDDPTLNPEVGPLRQPMNAGYRDQEPRL